MIKLKELNLKIMWSYEEVKSKDTHVPTIKTTCKLFNFDGSRLIAEASAIKSVEDLPDKNKARKITLRKALVKAGEVEGWEREESKEIRSQIWEAYFIMRTITVPASVEHKLVKY